jgi:hypothetical protein
MDAERRLSAGKVAEQLMLIAGAARESGRWAQGAEVLEAAAQDIIVNAAHPEQREIRNILSWLEPLADPKV